MEGNQAEIRKVEGVNNTAHNQNTPLNNKGVHSSQGVHGILSRIDHP